MDTRVVAATPVFRWSRSRRKISIRRRKAQVLRLGGKNNVMPRGRLSLKRIVRRMKLKWLRLYYVRLVKKIKGYYSDLVKELIDAGAELEAIQQRMAVEAAAFAVPGLGLSLTSMSLHEYPPPRY